MNELDPEEKEILASYDKGEWQQVSNLESEIERYRKYSQKESVESVDLARKGLD